MSLIESIKENEGFRGTVYKDTLGFDTIAYGTKLPLTEEEGELLLEHRLNKIQKDLNIRIKEEYNSPFILQKVWRVLDEMAYQMGVSGVMKFKKMLSAIVGRRYREAANEGLNSLWAKQTPTRANELMNKIRNIQ